MPSRSYEEALRQKKDSSTLEALFRAARLGNEMALRRLREKQPQGPPVRAAHMALFPHIDFSGTRITTLAERVGTSKQAVSELVEELSEMGVVKRVSDPTDGRAKLVTFTPRGRQGILEGLSLLIDLESDLSKQMGAKKMRELRRLLHELLPLLTPSAPEKSAGASGKMRPISAEDRRRSSRTGGRQRREQSGL